MINANAIEQLQILYEISMSVGSSLDLRSMLKNSLSTLLKKLNCSAGGVLFLKPEPLVNLSTCDQRDLHFEQVFAIPRNTAFIETYQEALRCVTTLNDAHELAEFYQKLPLSGRGGVESYFHILELPDVGLLILTRNGDDLDPNILKSLKPLMYKLASACKACEQNKALRESEMRYRESLDQTRAALAETRRVEEELRVSKERLISLHRFQNELLDTAAIWIDMFDAKGNITFWNLAAERISGFSRDEVLGHAKIWKWLYPDYNYRSQMINTAKIKLQRNESLEDFETTIRCKNGEERIIRWHSNNFIDEHGHTMKGAGFGAGIGIGADITEHKRAEKALKDSKRNLTDIINFLPDPTLVIDKAGRVVSWNRAIEIMTGVRTEDILGKGDYEYAIPFYGQRRPILIDLVLNSNEEFEKNYSNIKRKGEILVGDVHIMNLNGDERYLFGTATALYDSRGELVGAIESIRDITERKQVEEALFRAHNQLELKVKERTIELETRNAEMERFVYTVSHDLRTPLISISGFVDFIEQDAEKGDLEHMKADIRIVNEAVARMDSLLQDTLELSRIGRIVNPSENVPFNEIIEDALGLLAVKIHAKNVKILTRRDWPEVHVDKMRISEVLVNLIENSLKYMSDQPNPEIELGYRLDREETVFFVRDNGIGIDPSQHDKIFGLFYKVDKESKGTGVGLAIVKRIIEVHGGRIWIESELGKGCTVCFTLPLAVYE